MSISWREAMSVGVASLDNDHKKIIAVINHVDAGIAQKNFATTGKALDVLQRYVTEHFQLEEALMKRIGYPDLEFHQKMHKGLAGRVESIAKAFKAAGGDPERRKISVDLSSFLQGWLVEHILREDLRIKPYLPQQSAADIQEPPPGPSMVLSDPGSTPAPLVSQATAARSEDVEYVLPPALAHLMERLDYPVPDMPPPTGGHASFASLCDAAINRRANKILIFFQRSNPDITRELPPFFLGSPAFAEKFRAAVSKFILPTILGNRQVRQLSVSHDWSDGTDEDFWDKLDNHLKTAILFCWDTAWNELKLVSVKKEDGTSVLQVKENTKELRTLLTPTNPSDYDIPRITNREIETFKSLLDTKIDWWEELNYAWTICHDLYEQEKNPRIFQSRARSGALRDNLLAAFGSFPDPWCDFLVLACHRVFPRISTAFLESFVASIASNDSVRDNYMPYTMRYLRQARESHQVRERENREELLHQAEMKKVQDFLSGRTTAF